jgi:hypothetical protein
VHQLFIVTSLQLLLFVIQKNSFRCRDFQSAGKKSAKLNIFFLVKTAEISHHRNYRLYGMIVSFSEEKHFTYSCALLNLCLTLPVFKSTICTDLSLEAV